ncbi:hypothetical protein F383_24543 [Gossypium arboreum]|uniref:Uncharacterized protein n=1 Tax=Gossypium arboreum TaxID=29729 RepID=A0A0B0P234_GOSAR|nr:hypothetical protein F383_24543 [Gossypium arboreum]
MPFSRLLSHSLHYPLNTRNTIGYTENLHISATYTYIAKATS